MLQSSEYSVTWMDICDRCMGYQGLQDDEAIMVERHISLQRWTQLALRLKELIVEIVARLQDPTTKPRTEQHYLFRRSRPRQIARYTRCSNTQYRTDGWSLSPSGEGVVTLKITKKFTSSVIRRLKPRDPYTLYSYTMYYTHSAIAHVYPAT